jgi:hypothetical protein
MIQQTSLIAYREIQPTLGPRQLEVYRVLQDATRKGFDMTNNELSAVLKLPINCITGRVFELRQKDLVTLSCKRSCGRTRRLAMAWRTT